MKMARYEYDAVVGSLKKWKEGMNIKGRGATNEFVDWWGRSGGNSCSMCAEFACKNMPKPNIYRDYKKCPISDFTPADDKTGYDGEACCSKEWANIYKIMNNYSYKVGDYKACHSLVKKLVKRLEDILEEAETDWNKEDD